jgi:HAD superfamily hydrolase (TIGR01484 family)
MRTLLLFDVDGTLVESGEKIDIEMVNLLNNLKDKNYELGIVGGGKLEKILQQLDNKILFKHYFSECGCVYHINKNNTNNLLLEEIYIKNIRNHKQYNNINILIKTTLKYLSEVDYTLSGHFVDLRNGIIYISLIGMNATQEERKYYMEKEKIYNYRLELITILKEKAKQLNCLNNISILLGGNVGIALYPNDYDKEQVLQYININNYKKIYFFGDKYLEDGNDYKLLNNKNIIGKNIDTIENTKKILRHLLINTD